MAQYHNLNKEVRIDPGFIYAAAGQTSTDTPVFDMLKFETIRAGVLIGDVTTAATVNFYAQHSTVSTGTFVSIAGSSALFQSSEGSSGVWMISEVYRPRKRYVKFVLDRGTANTQILGGFVERARALELPVDESTNTLMPHYARSVTGSSS